MAGYNYNPKTTTSTNGAGGGRGGRGRGFTKTWSEPMPLSEAAKQAPVLVRLEEGDRGEEEALSFSVGDKMALQGWAQFKGRPVLLAHYVTELEVEEERTGGPGVGQMELYRALVTLPRDSLPCIDVCILQDPNRSAYSKFVSTNFPNQNWDRDSQAIIKGELNNKNSGARLVIPITPPHQSSAVSAHKTPSDKEHWKLSEPSQPTPSIPRRQISNPTDARKEDSSAVPPRPPRLKTNTPQVNMMSPAPVQEKPPPRPPRRSPSDGAYTPQHKPQPGGAHTLQYKTPSGGKKTPQNKSPSGGAHTPYGATGARSQKLGQSESTSVPCLSDVFSSGPYREEEFQAILSQMEKKSTGKTTKIKEVPGVIATSNTSAAGGQSDNDEDDEYTEIDERMMNPDLDIKVQGKRRKDAVPRNRPQEIAAAGGGQGRPVGRVTPLTSKPQYTSTPSKPITRADDADEDVYEVMDNDMKPVSSPLMQMTCHQLCARLRRCGLKPLATVCQERSVDGEFFCGLSDETLQKPPFSLDNFAITEQLKKVKAGWVPK